MESLNEKKLLPERMLRQVFGIFTVICFAAAAIMPDRADAFAGLGRICTQSGQTVKSYFDVSYGGFAGTFLNVALVCLVMTLLYMLPGAKPDGVSALAFFLTAGFCFWGTTILNIWFTFAGVVLYCIIRKKQVGAMANAVLFSTGIAPLITEMLFHYPAAEWHGWTVSGVLIALAVGIFIGFMVVPGLGYSPKVHKGFDLYSAALPIGLIAFFLRSLLYKVFLPEPPASVGVGLGDSFTLICNAFCLVVFGGALIWGLVLGGGKQYGALIRDSGYNVDYLSKYGAPTAIMNLGVYGLFTLAYYNLIGANWNGATLGIVFCMVCCFAKGSHPLNVLPIMLGYAAASFIAKYVCGLTGADFNMAVNAQAIMIGLCYASGLCPISGEYGFLAGILGGMFHYTLVTCVPLMHGAFCLYNGGFTAALTCMILIPVLEHFFKTRSEKAKA